MPRSAEYDLVVDYLGFEWIDVEDLIRHLSGRVLPGKAIRKYTETYERAKSERNGLGPAKGPLPEMQQIASGARALLRAALRSAVDADNVQEKKVGSTTFVRLNVFNADQVETILASKTPDLMIAAPSGDKPKLEQLSFDDLLFDIRTVKTVPVKVNGNLVTVTIDNVIEGRPVTLSLTPQAADWLSDQLGFQALAIRNGRENPHKAIPASRDSH